MPTSPPIFWHATTLLFIDFAVVPCVLDGLKDIFKKICVSQDNSFAETGLGLPAELLQVRNVQQLPGCPVRFGGIKYQLAMKADNPGNQLRQFTNGELTRVSKVHGAGE